MDVARQLSSSFACAEAVAACKEGQRGANSLVAARRDKRAVWMIV